MSVRTPLVHPARYFRSEDRRVHGKHIVGLYVTILLLNFMSITLVVNWWTGEYPWRIYLLGIFVLAPVIFVVAYTIVWMFIATTMHYLTGGARPEESHQQALKDYLTGGDSPEGSYGQALDVAGWAFAPELLFDGLVLFPIAWYDLTQIRAPTRSEIVMNAERLQAGYLGMFADFVEFIGAIWIVYILIYGVATTHDVSPRRAFIPAFLIFLFQVWYIVRPL